MNQQIQSDYYLFKKFIQYILKEKRLVSFSLAFLFIQTGLSLLGPYIWLIVVDDYIMVGKSDGIFFLAAIYLLIYLLWGITTYFLLLLMEKIGHGVTFELRKDSFARVQILGMDYHDTTPAGDIVSRIMQDTSVLQGWFSGRIIYALAGIVFTLAAFFIMLSISPILTLLSLIVIPFVFIVTNLSKKLGRVAWAKTLTINSKLTSIMTENILGIRVSHSFSRKEENIKNFEKINSEYYEAWQKAIRVDAPVALLFNLLITIGLVIVYYFGGVMVMDGKIITIGTLFLFIFYQTTFLQNLTEVADYYSITQSSFAAFERIISLQNKQPSIIDSNKEQNIQVNEGKIEFENVVFSYRDGDPILNNFNLVIPGKQRIAIVGETGSGKTTIGSLLSRLYEISEGKIQIDHQNIASVGVNSLRKNVGIVTQDPFLFSGSIRENITYGSNLTDATVVDILQQIGATFVFSLSKGLDSQVGERGIRLSAGQKQLISLARVLAHNPKIIILDEATSSIDVQTELLIQKNINALIRDRTSITIAHRISTIRDAERIIVIGDGKILEDGTLDELLESRGKFHQLYNLQYQK